MDLSKDLAKRNILLYSYFIYLFIYLFFKKKVVLFPGEKEGRNPGSRGSAPCWLLALLPASPSFHISEHHQTIPAACPMCTSKLIGSKSNSWSSAGYSSPVHMLQTEISESYPTDPASSQSPCLSFVNSAPEIIMCSILSSLFPAPLPEFRILPASIPPKSILSHTTQHSFLQHQLNHFILCFVVPWQP